MNYTSFLLLFFLEASRHISENKDILLSDASMSDEYASHSVPRISEEVPFNKVAEEIVLNDQTQRNHLSGQVQAILSFPISIYHLAGSWTHITTDHLWRTSKVTRLLRKPD
jgi:hypothetical protein